MEKRLSRRVFKISLPPEKVYVARETAFGLRWQSAAATALLSCESECNLFQSGVALRLPPQSKISCFEITVKDSPAHMV